MIERVLYRAALVALVGLVAAGPVLDVPTTAPHGAVTSLRPVWPAASTQLIEKSVRYLASDELEGRGVGTAGLDKAATFIAQRFEAVGLLTPAQIANSHAATQPAAFDGYFQRLSITTTDGVGPRTVLASGPTTYKAQADYAPLGISAQKAFEGGVVFAGYGVTSKQHNYDDFAGVDVKGKVALVLRYEPRDARGRSRLSTSGWSSAAELTTKARNAAARGAQALLVVTGPDGTKTDMLIGLSKQTMGSPAPIPVIHVKRALAEELLRLGQARDLRTLQGAIDGTFTPQSAQLKDVSLRGNVELLRKEHPIRNVIGILRGRGARSDQIIVIGGHYDHLGNGGMGSRAGDSRDIHPGADDNASGTAAVIECARVLADAPESLDRSVMFVAFTAEESGLVGSRHFVNNPPVPLGRIGAMVNLDMVGRMRGNVLHVGGTGSSSSFESMVNESARGLPLALKSAFKSGYAPSDNTSFMIKKIPALFLFTGLHADYHRPSDTADKIDFGGIASVVDLTCRAAVRLSHEARLDFIAPAASAPATMRAGERTGGGASLGIIPDYGSDAQIVGVLISGAMPGTPAEKAGLKEGDILVQLGEHKLASLEDLADALAEATPGEKTTLVYTREGKTVRVEVVLAERRRRD
jgi:hypothetical protein